MDILRTLHLIMPRKNMDSWDERRSVEVVEARSSPPCERMMPSNSEKSSVEHSIYSLRIVEAVLPAS